MKKIILISVSILSCFYMSYIHSMPIHSWEVGGTSNWRTSISFSNMCKHHNAQVKLKFWKSDGTVLANQQVYLIGSQWNVVSTDSNGELIATLLPHEARRVLLQHTFFPGGSSFIGSARITTSYDEPGPRCVTAGYYTWSSGTSSNSGASASFLVNGGHRF